MIVKQAHKLLITFFSTRHSLRTKLIPYYLKLGLSTDQNSGPLRQLFAQHFGAVLSDTVPPEKGIKREQLLQETEEDRYKITKYCIEKLRDHIIAHIEKQKTVPRHLMMLFVSMTQLLDLKVCDEL
jgi:hypothetical protein